MTLHDDRRLRRSDDPLVALHFQLTHARHEAALDTVVVADGAGLVVAGAGSWAACEELAAFAPLLASGQPVGAARVEALRARVSVRAIDVAGDRLLLCSTRNEAAPSGHEAVLARAASGVSRILQERAA